MHRLLQLGIAGGLAIAGLVPQVEAADLANLRNGFSIRHERHEVVGEFTRLYTSAEADDGYIDVPTAQIESYEPAPPEPQPLTGQLKKAQDLSALVQSASEQSQVDADFIASVIRAESANNPHAVSHKGARGLMQLMPATANKLGVKDSFDPADNVDGGARYLRELLLLYDNDMVKALAAYNAGPERVQQYKGIPPYRETLAYVARVINDYNRKKLAERRQLGTSAVQAKSSKQKVTQHPAGSSTTAAAAPTAAAHKASAAGSD